MLTDLWILTPDWLFWRVIRLLGWDPEVVHEILCESLGCRC